MRAASAVLPSPGAPRTPATRMRGGPAVSEAGSVALRAASTCKRSRARAGAASAATRGQHLRRGLRPVAQRHRRAVRRRLRAPVGVEQAEARQHRLALALGHDLHAPVERQRRVGRDRRHLLRLERGGHLAGEAARRVVRQQRGLRRRHRDAERERRRQAPRLRARPVAEGLRQVAAGADGEQQRQQQQRSDGDPREEHRTPTRRGGRWRGTGSCRASRARVRRPARWRRAGGRAARPRRASGGDG